MDNDMIFKQISEGLISIDEQLKKRINAYSDMNINMKENLESLQASVLEIEKYIEHLKKNIEDEENIFFLGVGSQENKRELEAQERNKIDLDVHIKDLKERIIVEEEKRNFLEDISNKLTEYNTMINKIEYGKNNSNKSILDQLKMCQKLSKIDHERCYIEIGKIIEVVEEWEKQ